MDFIDCGNKAIGIPDNQIFFDPDQFFSFNLEWLEEFENSWEGRALLVN